MRAPATSVGVVCFDIGGVLVRICSTLREACRAAGLPERDETAIPEVEEKRRRLELRLAAGRISLEDWSAEVSRAVDGVYTPDETRRAHDAITRDEFAGALAIVDALRNAGVPTACLSNTDRSHWVRLIHRDDAGPLPGVPEYPSVARLDRHFASYLLGLAKPDPAIYAAFEQRTGLSGSDVLFFDDSVENIESARRRGWLAHRIDPLGNPSAQVREHLRSHGVLAPE
jgi:FMN phosphatase YigB (HAD superfamily)